MRFCEARGAGAHVIVIAGALTFKRGGVPVGRSSGLRVGGVGGAGVSVDDGVGQ